MSKIAKIFSFLRYPLAILVIVVLPFIVLVRGAIEFYYAGWTGYLALLFSSFITLIILLIYMVIIDRLLTERVLLEFKYKVIIVTAVLVFFNIYGLYVLSDTKVKTTELSSEYTNMHPLLRIAVSTVSYFERSLVITDMARVKRDYTKMGLGKKENSLHYTQADGYVHAVDLRTNGRSMVRNWLSEMIFKLLGFRTLRHIGTADHLHISLPT